MLNGIFKVFLGIVLTIFSLPILAEEIRDYYSEPGITLRRGCRQTNQYIIESLPPIIESLAMTGNDTGKLAITSLSR